MQLVYVHLEGKVLLLARLVAGVLDRPGERGLAVDADDEKVLRVCACAGCAFADDLVLWQQGGVPGGLGLAVVVAHLQEQGEVGEGLLLRLWVCTCTTWPFRSLF